MADAGKPNQNFSLEPNEQVGNNLVNVMEVLQKIDLDDPLAKLNETSISDNNGGRIEL